MPANFPLGFARELAANKIRLQPTNGLFWPEREAKNRRGTSADAARSRHYRNRNGARDGSSARVKAEQGKKLCWSGKTLTSEILRAEIDTAILRAGGLPANTIVAGGDQACDPHERGLGPLFANSLIILDIFPRDAASGYYGDMTRTVVRGRASEKQRKLWETVRAGQALALKKMKPGVDGMNTAQRDQKAFRRPRLSDRSAQGTAGRIFSRHRPRARSGDSRISAIPKDSFQSRTGADRRAGSLLSRLGGVRMEDVVFVTRYGHPFAVAFREAAGNLNEPPRDV